MIVERIVIEKLGERQNGAGNSDGRLLIRNAEGK